MLFCYGLISGGKRKDPSVGNTSGNNRRRINASTKQDPSYTHSFGFFLLLFLFLSDSLSCISLLSHSHPYISLTFSVFYSLSLSLIRTHSLSFFFPVCLYISVPSLCLSLLLSSQSTQSNITSCTCCKIIGK